METSDPHLECLARIGGGSEAALSDLYAAFKARVYNTVLGMLQNEADAEEVTQDVFVKIYQSAARFEGKSSVATWIYRIAVNHALSKLSHRKRQKRFAWIVRLSGADSTEPALDLPFFEHPGIILEKKENARILFKAIESLPEQQQTAFVLSFVEALPRQEVADIMEISLKAVESLLQRAKANLRARLDHFYP